MQVVTDAQPPQDGPSTGGWEPAGPPVVTGRQLRELLADDAWLDELIERAGDGGVRLTGEGGFLPELVTAVLERGLAVELADHLGYERGGSGRPGLAELPQRQHSENVGDRGRAGADDHPAGPGPLVRAAAGPQGAAPPRRPRQDHHLVGRGWDAGARHRRPSAPHAGHRAVPR